MAKVTLQYPAHTSKTGYASLQKACQSTAFLYNLIIKQRNYASSTHRHRYNRRITGHDITELSNSEPEFQRFGHKLLTNVEQQVHRAFNAYFDYLSKRKQDIPATKRGRPKTKDPTPAIHSPFLNRKYTTSPSATKAIGNSTYTSPS